MTSEMVVARFRENFSWTKDPRLLDYGAILVYDKSGTPTPGTIPLPNEGREAHTYLTYILIHYDHLPDWVTFCQGNPFDHAPHFLSQAKLCGKMPEVTFFGTWLQCDALGRPHCDRNPDGTFGLPLGEITAMLMPEHKDKRMWEFCAGACFRVSRKSILARPLSFYQRMVALGYEDGWPGLDVWGREKKVHWDMAHCYERLWQLVFQAEG